MENKNEYFIVEKQTLDRIERKVDQFLNTQDQSKSESEWLDLEEAGKLLGKSKRIVLELVHKRELPYSQIGRKYYFKVSDIDAMIEKFYIQSK